MGDGIIAKPLFTHSHKITDTESTKTGNNYMTKICHTHFPLTGSSFCRTNCTFWLPFSNFLFHCTRRDTLAEPERVHRSSIWSSEFSGSLTEGETFVFKGVIMIQWDSSTRWIQPMWKISCVMGFHTINNWNPRVQSFEISYAGPIWLQSTNWHYAPSRTHEVKSKSIPAGSNAALCPIASPELAQFHSSAVRIYIYKNYYHSHYILLKSLWRVISKHIIMD
jgi:hypothetical protein